MPEEEQVNNRPMATFVERYFSGASEFHVVSTVDPISTLLKCWAPTNFWLMEICHVCGQQDKLPEGFPLMTKCLHLPDGHVMDEHLAASRTPELTLSACTTLTLAGICLAIQSYC